MADAISFQIFAASESAYTLGDIPSSPSGTAGAVVLAGATLILGGISFGTAGMAQGCIFETPGTGAAYSAVVIPEASAADAFPPISSGTLGTFGAVSTFGETYALGSLTTGLSIGSMNSCLFALSPVTTIPGTTPTGSGGRLIWRCPNFYDNCLEGERTIRRKIDWDRLIRFAPGNKCLHPCPPWLKPPEDSTVFRPFEIAVLPGVEEVDSLILETTVPPGRDGLIQGIMFQFTGSGYEIASNDIRWRLRIGNWFVKDFSSVLTPLGDIAGGCWTIGTGQRIQSRQLVRVYANLGPGALSRLSPDGKFLTVLDGYLYSQAAWRSVT
jgi:hypothetical protein